MVVCHTVGIAYVGSNPTPATIKINRPGRQRDGLDEVWPYGVTALDLRVPSPSCTGLHTGSTRRRSDGAGSVANEGDAGSE